MASVVIAGGGIAALATAMLLADDGHQVTVLERDPAPPPDPSSAWDGWERRGVNQFRLPHLFVSRFRTELDRELPRAIKALEEAGALRFNPLALAPPELVGPGREDDCDYEMLTGRRAVMEAVLADLAEHTPGVTVRRGAAVGGLLLDEHHRPADGSLRVIGVHTSDGDQVAGDLVVDATGRRSPLSRWLQNCGGHPPVEEAEDSGFVYYCRHFRSAHGTIPASIGPGLQEHGSISSLTLPADNGTWAVVLVASSTDRALRGLRDPQRWTAAVRAMPLVTHWINAEPLDERVVTIAKIEDRHRSLVVNGQPVATGIVMLADAWACTNPSLGRGVTLGVMHGKALRDTLRRSDPADSRQLAVDFHEATTATVEPWYQATLHYDRHRLAEIDAYVDQRPYEPADERWDAIRSLQYAAGRDPDCLRASLAITNVMRTPDDVLAQPGILQRARAVGNGWRQAQLPGPTREELVAIATD